MYKLTKIFSGVWLKKNLRLSDWRPYESGRHLPLFYLREVIRRENAYGEPTSEIGTIY